MDSIAKEEWCSCEPKIEREGKQYPPVRLSSTLMGISVVVRGCELQICLSREWFCCVTLPVLLIFFGHAGYGGPEWREGRRRFTDWRFVVDGGLEILVCVEMGGREAQGCWGSMEAWNGCNRSPFWTFRDMSATWDMFSSEGMG